MFYQKIMVLKVVQWFSLSQSKLGDFKPSNLEKSCDSFHSFPPSHKFCLVRYVLLQSLVSLHFQSRQFKFISHFKMPEAEIEIEKICERVKLTVHPWKDNMTHEPN